MCCCTCRENSSDRTKPGTLILLIAWFTQIGDWRGGLLWFGLGLVFSLAGDVLLHLPGKFFRSDQTGHTDLADRLVYPDWGLARRAALVRAGAGFLTGRGCAAAPAGKILPIGPNRAH